MDLFPHPSGTHSVRPVCSISPLGDENQEAQERYVLRGNLEVTSIGFVGTNPESTPLPGVDYFKNQEVYEEKRHKASIAIEPERERKN